MALSLSRRTVFGIAIVAALGGAALIAAPGWAEKSSVYQTDGGVAVNGYDVVAYFSDAKPVEGSDEFTVEHAGATWQFASAENRDAFSADPGRYEPQYGGYCAYAVSKGSTATTVPDAWKIVDDKLYLNYSKGVQQTWEKDIPGYIDKADANWPDVLD